jgi:hypothetical protein
VPCVWHYGVSPQSGLGYLVMDRVEGMTLGEMAMRADARRRAAGGGEEVREGLEEAQAYVEAGHTRAHSWAYLRGMWPAVAEAVSVAVGGLNHCGMLMPDRTPHNFMVVGGDPSAGDTDWRLFVIDFGLAQEFEPLRPHHQRAVHAEWPIVSDAEWDASEWNPDFF